MLTELLDTGSGISGILGEHATMLYTENVIIDSKSEANSVYQCFKSSRESFIPRTLKNVVMHPRDSRVSETESTYLSYLQCLLIQHNYCCDHRYAGVFVVATHALAIMLTLIVSIIIAVYKHI